MIVLITGAAGFIGYHLCLKLLSNGIQVVGFDNLNSYYDVSLKHARLKRLSEEAIRTRTQFDFVCDHLENHSSVFEIFNKYTPDIVVNLAAQAGVRHSIEEPLTFINSNLLGFGNILEACRKFEIRHLLYASSSSVYGGNTILPFAESQCVEHPVSLYAATKKANELMAHSYSHLYGLPTTGLRFFTVYGPWGRPDMALFLFTKAILDGDPIKVFNNGKMARSFTFIDDIIESIFRLLDKLPSENLLIDKAHLEPHVSWAPYRIVNIGNASLTPLLAYIEAIEEALNMKAIKTYLPLQLGDVPETSADTSELQKLIGYIPNTSIQSGVQQFVNWYRNYYNV